MTRLIAALLLAALAACAPEREIPSIEGATRAIVLVHCATGLGMKLGGYEGLMLPPGAAADAVRPCRLKRVKEVQDAGELDALEGFANDRRDGFIVPERGPVTNVMIMFYKGEEFVDNFGVEGKDGTYALVRMTSEATLYRRLPLEDLAILAGLLGYKADEIFIR